MAVKKKICRRGDQLASGSLHRRARIGVEWVGDVCMRKRASWIFFFLAVTFLCGFAIWRERLGPGRHPRASLSLPTGDRSREHHMYSQLYLT